MHKDPADDLTRNDFSLAMLMRLGVVRMRDLGPLIIASRPIRAQCLCYLWHTHSCSLFLGIVREPSIKSCIGSPPSLKRPAGLGGDDGRHWIRFLGIGIGSVEHANELYSSSDTDLAWLWLWRRTCGGFVQDTGQGPQLDHHRRRHQDHVRAAAGAPTPPNARVLS